MGANKSNTEENNKDEIWYGWIPKLSHEMIVRVGTENDYGNKIFDEVTEDDLKKVFKKDNRGMLLSDKKIDVLFKNKHMVEFSDHKIISCGCCKETVWSVAVKINKIKGKNNDGLIKGIANIHKSGLVRYEILHNEVTGKYSKNKAQDIHKIIRDHLHFHLYHSSDMPLSPVKVDEECDEDLAKEKILKKLLDMFIEHKRNAGKVRLTSDMEDLSSAIGKIVYANSALDKFFYTSKKEENKELEYLFSWDDVPKNNTELIKFLKNDLKIEGVENAKIEKSKDGKTITVTKDKNSIEIKLDEKKDKLILKASSGETHEYISKKENSKLNIYELGNNYEEFKRSFENFNESFKVLLQRDSNRWNRASQYIMILLSFTIVIFASINTLSYIQFPQFIQSCFSSDDSIKLLLAIWFFVILYLFAKIRKLQGAQK